MPISLAQTPGRERRCSKPCTTSTWKFCSSLPLPPRSVRSTTVLGRRRRVQSRPCTTPRLVSVPISHGSLQTGTIHSIPSSSSSRFRAASHSVSPVHCLPSASAFPPSRIPFSTRSIVAWPLQVRALVYSPRDHFT